MNSSANGGDLCLPKWINKVKISIKSPINPYLIRADLYTADMIKKVLQENLLDTIATGSGGAYAYETEIKFNQ
jgi:hypothetical protein